MESKESDFIDIETMDSASADSTLLNSRFLEGDTFNDPELQPPSIDYDSIGEFCFESEQLALKGNTDYKNLLEAIVVLESQRMKAAADLHQLIKLKESALENPLKFLEEMKQGLGPKFPFPQKIHPLPFIDWGKYAVNEDPTVFSQRQKKNCFLNKSKQSSLQNDSDSLKSNSVWSENEQKRLKELLVEFPPEEPESLRWENISKSLSSRTPFEVATRVHKYYSILEEEVPSYIGKLPDLICLRKLWYHDGLDESSDVNYGIPVTSESSYDDPSLNADLHETPEFQELLLLEKALKKKMMGRDNRMHGDNCLCMKCRMRSTDLSSASAEKDTELFPGPCLSENNVNQRIRKGFVDTDYLTSSPSSYLDPNYLPAT